MTVMTASERGIRADGAMSKLSRIRAIVAASSGNLVEWYDFYAYAFTSIYFAAAFFPSGDQTSQLLATAGILP
jgi:MHS family alpha-ketoglutarate permease-like MFS transporter